MVLTADWGRNTFDFWKFQGFPKHHELYLAALEGKSTEQ
jgi:hypothetical protein